MLFHTLTFILGFLPATLAGFFLLGRHAGPRPALGFLLAASLVFYGWWDPALLPLLLGSILGNWLVIRRISAARSTARASAWFALGVSVNLGVLGAFKYTGFVWQIAAPGTPPPDVTLPLAISFFTFQQIMALADARAGTRDGPPSLISHAAFVAFFPHLIAGPLVRPREILPQLASPRLAIPDREALSDGAAIFLLGLGKKLVLADTFGSFADPGFDAAERGERLTLFEAWYALLAYALQIYFDFSGYSDMAIGLARMCNVRFPLNFDSPYQADSIAAFWRRWHMTLGQFLRDFVYIPLGGSHAGLGRQVAALLATMLLCGLWHGAGWRFVVWGGVHGALLAAHAAWRRAGLSLPGVPARMLTLAAVVLAWVPFRAADLSTSLAFLGALAGANGVALPAMIAEVLPVRPGWVEAVPVLRFLGYARTLSFPEVTACLILGWTIALAPTHLHRWRPGTRAWALAGSFAFSVQALVFAPQVAPFLYFQF